MEVVILTERGAKLYLALASTEENEGWVNTEQLAAMTDKNQLSQHDRGLLEGMVERGYIEEREVRTKTGFGRPAKQFRAL